MVRYPTTRLPQPVRDSYQQTEANQRVRTLMDDGHYQVSRRYGARPMRFTVSWIYTWKQLATFEAWYEYDVLRGDGWFLLDIAGQERELFPTSAPTVQYLGGAWMVTVEVQWIAQAPVIAPRTGVLPSWPADLPTLESDGYGFSSPNVGVRDSMQKGLDEFRKRFEYTNTVFNGTLILEPFQRDLFWDFYNNALISGNAWFIAPFANGIGVTMQRARIADPSPVETCLNGIYQISVSLETANAPLLSYAEYSEGRESVNDYVEDGYVEAGYVGYYI